MIADLNDAKTTIEDVLRLLGGAPDRVKNGALWLAERSGRLKLNGRIVGYSDLSRLEELESLGMLLGFEGSLWRSLGSLEDDRLEGHDFALLLARSSEHIRSLENHLTAAAARALDRE